MINILAVLKNFIKSSYSVNKQNAFTNSVNIQLYRLHLIFVILDFIIRLLYFTLFLAAFLFIYNMIKSVISYIKKIPIIDEQSTLHNQR
jgi:hypothetical protein